jgi:DNA-binding LytR/AlgR family response regulator
MEHDSDSLRRALQVLAESDAAQAPSKPAGRSTAERLLRELLSALAPRSYLRWIRASFGRTVRLIKVDDVLYFQADTKYTRVVTADSVALIRTPLKQLQEELDPEVFWPIHRSTVVNAEAISGATRDARGRVQVRLKQSADLLAVSEGHTHLFRQM